MKMKLNDVPNIAGVQFPSKVSVAVSKEMKQQIDELRRKGKDRSAFIRMAIDRSLRELAQDAG